MFSFIILETKCEPQIINLSQFVFWNSKISHLLFGWMVAGNQVEKDGALSLPDDRKDQNHTKLFGF